MFTMQLQNGGSLTIDRQNVELRMATVGTAVHLHALNEDVTIVSKNRQARSVTVRTKSGDHKELVGILRCAILQPAPRSC